MTGDTSHCTCCAIALPSIASPLQQQQSWALLLPCICSLTWHTAKIVTSPIHLGSDTPQECSSMYHLRLLPSRTNGMVPSHWSQAVVHRRRLSRLSGLCGAVCCWQCLHRGQPSGICCRCDACKARWLWAWHVPMCRRSRGVEAVRLCMPHIDSQRNCRDECLKCL